MPRLPRCRCAALTRGAVALRQVWLIIREGMIRFGIQCEFALDELRRTKPDLCVCVLPVLRVLALS